MGTSLSPTVILKTGASLPGISWLAVRQKQASKIDDLGGGDADPGPTRASHRDDAPGGHPGDW